MTSRGVVAFGDFDVFGGVLACGGGGHAKAAVHDDFKNVGHGKVTPQYKLSATGQVGPTWHGNLNETGSAAAGRHQEAVEHHYLNMTGYAGVAPHDERQTVRTGRHIRRCREMRRSRGDEHCAGKH